MLFLAPFEGWAPSLKTRRHGLRRRTGLPESGPVQGLCRGVDVAPILHWFTNSAIVSVLAAVSVTLSSALVAFAFAYFRFPFRNLLFGLVLASMMLPGAVTMVPTFRPGQPRQGHPGDRINTLTPLWATNLFGSAFYIFLLLAVHLGLPREVFEAARVDGANYFRMWWAIAVPLTLPALVVVFIFELKASWTDFLRPLIYIRDVDLFTFRVA